MTQQYLNHFPGSMYDQREIFFSDNPRYAPQGVAPFLHSIAMGCTASVSTDGLLPALEDGALLGRVLSLFALQVWPSRFEDCDPDEVYLQEIVEEVHALLIEQEAT